MTKNEYIELLRFIQNNLKNENNNVMWKFKIQKRDDGNCRKNGFIR